jgi:mannose/fructose/N-acetylgalactosamine-specific phosphotransferase system component IID
MAWALWQTFVRSFFLQTLWNFERMQNVGFAFSMVPLLKQLDYSKTAFRQVLRRQLMFFNTHPYFAPLVMGVVYAKEKAREQPESEDPTLTVLKDSMGGAFGAVGDHVIWGTWRPFCAIVALTIGVLVASPTQAWLVCAQWWVVGFLVLFNGVHIWLRWRGLQKAVQDGPGVVRWVESLHLQAWAAQIRRLGLLLLVGMVLVYLAHWTGSNLMLWMVGVLLSAVVMKRWSLSGFVIFYTVCALAITLSYFGVH